MSRPRIMTSIARCAPLSSSARSPARPDPLTPRRPLHRLRLLGDRDLPAPGARCLRVPAANRHHLAPQRARSRLGVPGGSQRDVGSAAVRAGGSRGRAHRELEGLAPRGAAFDQAHGPTRTPDRSRARLIPRPVDPGRALRGLYNPGVNCANAQRHAEQIAQQLGLAVRAVRDLDNRQRRSIQASLTRKNASTSHA